MPSIPAENPVTIAGIEFNVMHASIQVTSTVTPEGLKSIGRITLGRHHNAANGQSLADPTPPIVVTEVDLFNCSTPARQQFVNTIMVALATLNATEKLV